MQTSPLIDTLVESFCCLPGVGPKSAQRMALHLLERNREGGTRLANAMVEALENVGNCSRCRTLTEESVCRLCSSTSRNQQLCCVVESPSDIFAIEQSASFRGVYFVLMGHLSPIDGIGPEQLGIPLLVEKVASEGIKELIVASNPTVEGEATAFYIAEQFKGSDVVVSRIAHGVPVGGELEFVDGGTLTHAFTGRRIMASEFDSQRHDADSAKHS